MVHWKEFDGRMVAPPWLVYAELLTGDDPRAREAAEELDANSFNERDAHSRPDCGSRVSRAAVQRVGSGSRHQWKLNWQLESTCAWRPACHDVAEDHCIRRRSIPARQGPSGYPAGSHVSATYVETFLDRFVSEEEPDAEDDSLRESFTDRSTG